jgi:hypothetical protein
MPRNRASFFKRQREVTKKQKREEKLQRKLDRKSAAVDGAQTQPAAEAAEEGQAYATD